MDNIAFLGFARARALGLEDIIDKHLKDPVGAEKDNLEILKAMGLEPNLETTLSLIAGTCIGVVISSSVRKYGSLRKQDLLGAIELLRRRAWELRQTFLSTRIKG